MCVLVTGTVLFCFGRWCIDSSDIPAPPLALPLPQRFLAGLAFMLVIPPLLIPLALILTASGFLASKLHRLSSAVVILIGLTAVLVGAIWVPNPIALWPISILDGHTLPELIGELFPFHIVPSPEGSSSSSIGAEALFRWQLMECGARFCILILVWIACLVAIWRIDRRLKRANKSLQPTTIAPGS